MLFMIDSQHGAETCPAGFIHPDKDFSKKLDKAIADSGVKLVGGYLDAPGHHFYYIVDARSVEQVYSIAVPLLIGIGTSTVTPVVEWKQSRPLGRKAGVQN